MANTLGGRHAVPLEEIGFAQARQLEALANVLERWGVVSKAEVLAEITRLREKSVKARQKQHECREVRRSLAPKRCQCIPALPCAHPTSSERPVSVSGPPLRTGLFPPK